MKGKSIFLHMIKNVLGGDPKAIAKRAKEMRLSAVLVKAADGVGRFNIRPPLNLDDRIGPVMSELAALGIETWGWGFIYGTYPEREAEVTLERIRKFNFAGWIVDAEGHFETSGKRVAATRYMSTLRAGLPANYPVGLTTFRFPYLHLPFPWREFMEWSDFYVPQVYWQDAHNPAAQLDRSLNEYRRMEKQLALSPKPFYPAGAAYHEHGWQPTIPEIEAFHAKAKDLGLQAVTYWEWSHAQRYGFEQTLANLRWPGDEPLTLEQRVADLERRVAELEG